MDTRVDTIVDVCRALAADAPDTATSRLTHSYPFTAPVATPRRYGPIEATNVFVRDGFVDRYTGSRVVFPPVLRAISAVLPEDFPYHPNWKMDSTHPAYWELTATIDHLVPASRGGGDDTSNWVTTSMARNSAKGNWTLEDLGWALQPPGSFSEWDGLLAWYVDFTTAHPETLLDNSMNQWRAAALKVLT
jgi:hypothetical protein